MRAHLRYAMLAGLLAVAVFPLSAEAQDTGPLLQELLATETAFTQERRETQWTVSMRSVGRSQAVLRISDLVLEYGISDSWQVDASVSAFSLRDEALAERRTGIRAWTVGSRVGWRNIAGLGVHTGLAIELGQGRDASSGAPAAGMLTEVSASAAFDVRWLARGQLHVGAGLETEWDAGESEVEPRVALIVPMGMVRAVVEYGPPEPFGAFPTSRSRAWSIGAGLQAMKGLEVVAGVVGRGAPSREAQLKVTYEY